MAQDTTQPKALADVWTHLSVNGIVLEKSQMDDLQRYHDELLYWNQKVNLVSRKDVNMLWERHIIHSLLILKYVEIPYRSRVLDVGTGGGLPGIPLKIARPDIKITLVDSVAKKLNIASMLAQHTALKDITAVCSRVESLSQSAKYKKYFNVIVSRAVAPIAEIVQWTKDVRTEKATIVLLKGGDLTEEINNARKAHKEMVVTVYAIDAIGLPMFTQDEKKIVTCAFL